MNLFLNVFRTLVAVVIFMPASLSFAQSEKPELLLYCGITMVRPMTDIARLFEQRENAKITIAQGGSEDLYQSARKTGIGELYLPGEVSYYHDHLKEGLFLEHVTVGHNRLALMVKKAIPKISKAIPASYCGATSLWLWVTPNPVASARSRSWYLTASGFIQK